MVQNLLSSMQAHRINCKSQQKPDRLLATNTRHHKRPAGLLMNDTV